MAPPLQAPSPSMLVIHLLHIQPLQHNLYDAYKVVNMCILKLNNKREREYKGIKAVPPDFISTR